LDGKRYLVTNPNKIPKNPWRAVVGASITGQKLLESGYRADNSVVLAE
jgi:hypothetical protein